MDKIIVATAAVGPKTQALLERIDNFRLWMIGLMVAISVIFIIYAAYLYLLAGTQPDNINKAKQVILYVVLALAIALLSSLIVNVVGKLLGGNGAADTSSMYGGSSPYGKPSSKQLRFLK